MKLHKIRGIDLSVCSAEQMIAYNIANANHDIFTTAEEMLKTYTPSSKYNLDAIKQALTNGLQKYLERPFIATNYESVGKTFYLRE